MALRGLWSYPEGVGLIHTHEEMKAKTHNSGLCFVTDSVPFAHLQLAEPAGGAPPWSLHDNHCIIYARNADTRLAVDVLFSVLSAHLLLAGGDSKSPSSSVDASGRLALLLEVRPRIERYRTLPDGAAAARPLRAELYLVRD